jgi:hypothetical protein
MIHCFFVNFFLKNLTTEFLENFRINALDPHEDAVKQRLRFWNSDLDLKDLEKKSETMEWGIDKNLE